MLVVLKLVLLLCLIWEKSCKSYVSLATHQRRKDINVNADILSETVL